MPQQGADQRLCLTIIMVCSMVHIFHKALHLSTHVHYYISQQQLRKAMRLSYPPYRSIHLVHSGPHQPINRDRHSMIRRRRRRRRRRQKHRRSFQSRRPEIGQYTHQLLLLSFTYLNREDPLSKLSYLSRPTALASGGMTWRTMSFTLRNVFSTTTALTCNKGNTHLLSHSTRSTVPYRASTCHHLPSRRLCLMQQNVAHTCSTYM